MCENVLTCSLTRGAVFVRCFHSRAPVDRERRVVKKVVVIYLIKFSVYGSVFESSYESEHVNI